MYSDADVVRLSRLRALTEGGRTIGTVASLSDEEAEVLVSEDRAARVAPQETLAVRRDEQREERVVAEAFAAVEAMDDLGLASILRRAGGGMEGVRFLERVIARLLHRIGAAWAAGTLGPAREHLAMGVIDRVLTWLSESVGVASDGATLVVGTLPGERHGLGARLVAVTAALTGWRVIDLGIDLPPGEIAAAAEATGASGVALSLVNPTVAAGALGDVSRLRKALSPEVSLLLGGSGASFLPQSSLPDRVMVIDTLTQLQRILRETSRLSLPAQMRR